MTKRTGTLTDEDRDRIEKAATMLRNAVWAHDHGKSNAMDLVRGAMPTLAPFRTTRERRVPTDAVLARLDRLKQLLHEARSRLPAFPRGSDGNPEFMTGPYYRSVLGFDVSRRSDPALTDPVRIRLNEVGRWVNEATIVFLVATLPAHGVLEDGEPARRGVEGAEHVRVARDLRNISNCGSSCGTNRAGAVPPPRPRPDGRLLLPQGPCRATGHRRGSREAHKTRASGGTRTWIGIGLRERRVRPAARTRTTPSTTLSTPGPRGPRVRVGLPGWCVLPAAGAHHSSSSLGVAWHRLAVRATAPESVGSELGSSSR